MVESWLILVTRKFRAKEGLIKKKMSAPGCPRIRDGLIHQRNDVMSTPESVRHVANEKDCHRRPS